MRALCIEGTTPESAFFPSIFLSIDTFQIKPSLPCERLAGVPESISRAGLSARSQDSLIKLHQDDTQETDRHRSTQTRDTSTDRKDFEEAVQSHTIMLPYQDAGRKEEDTPLEAQASWFWEHLYRVCFGEILGKKYHVFMLLVRNPS